LPAAGIRFIALLSAAGRQKRAGVQKRSSACGAIQRSFQNLEKAVCARNATIGGHHLAGKLLASNAARSVTQSNLKAGGFAQWCAESYLAMLAQHGGKLHGSLR
jgi:hypothetical protein